MAGLKMAVAIIGAGLHGTTLAAQEISVLDHPTADKRNSFYISNRAPLLPSPFAKLPAGKIKPGGWLKKQLELQASGMCGLLPEISVFCIKEGNAWLSKDHRGHGAWEEVPYWLKGFGDLGYVLDDRRIQAETQEWIEAVLASQRADGWFGPLENLESPRIRPNIAGEQVQGRPDLWANALMLSVLRSNYEHTGDQRIVRLMLKFCDWLIALPEKDYLIHWVDKRRGIEHLQNILWLYNVTGEQRLLALAEKAHRRSSDWSSGISRAHNVDFSECFHEPGFYYTLSKDRKDLDSVERNRRTVYDEFGQVPGGMFGGDELMRPGYTDPRQAVETCGMVEMMNACEKMFTQIEGDIRWADRCEDVAFNSFPAALTADMKALRYLTAPNLVVSDRLSKSPDINNGDGMFVMNPHSHRCCQHNHSHGWPYYAEHLWLATPDDGLCAMLYSESTVSARIAGGQTVSVREKTHYPFCDTIEFAISIDAKEAPANFPLYLRVPGWCASPQLTINGRPVEVSAQPRKYIRIERQLPMHVAVRTWEKNQKSVSVDRGPLTYSLKIEEHYVPGNGLETIKSDKLKNARADFKAWPAFEIFSASPWNFGLVMEDGFKVVERPWPDNDMPWTQSTVPVTLAASARLIPGWKLQKNNLISKIIPSPVKSDAPVSSITLLPMGACRLRLSAFPTIGDAAIAPSAQDR